MKKAFLLILSAVWLVSAFPAVAGTGKRLCVEGKEGTRDYFDYCAAVKAKRIIYNCAPGFVLIYAENGYLCHRESTFYEGVWTSPNGHVPNKWDILDQTRFPCEPRNVPQDPEAGECMPGFQETVSDYYAQVNAYQVARGQIYDADDAEEMSRLCAYGDPNCGSPWSATISCGEAIPNCDICNGTLVCSECQSGYVLQDGKCVEQVACPSNCAECDSSGVCTKCDGGYVLKNGACAVMPETQVAFCPPDKTLTADLCCCVSK